MTPADVEVAEAITDEAFHRVDLAHHQRSWPEPQRRTESHRKRWRERVSALLDSDPGGSWVAELDGRVVGVATSIRRDLTWILCSYAIRAEVSGQGIGSALLDAAGQHARGCLRAMVACSNDPRAVRRYLLAGFTLQPWMVLSGSFDRSAIPTRSKVRVGSESDVDLLDSLDRRVRDAAHGPDHLVLLRHHPLLVVDRPEGQGYAYVNERGGVVLLAASSRRTATDLLWESLALTPEGADVEIGHVSAAQAWALDVAARARLGIYTSGYLGLRGMKTPAPYIPHGALL